MDEPIFPGDCPTPLLGSVLGDATSPRGRTRAGQGRAEGCYGIRPEPPGKMKAVLQVFPVLLLLLGLGWGYRLDPAILEDSQELLNQFWDSDSWEDAAEDMDVIQAMGPQEADDNDMLLLDSTESALAEAFLREDEVKDEEEPAAEDLFREEVTSYLRQVPSNGDHSVMMVWKAWEPENTCKAKRAVIHKKQEKGKTIHGAPNTPYEENKCSRSRQLLLTICQVTEDIVSPKKYNHKSPLVTVTITIACDGLGPLSFNC